VVEKWDIGSRHLVIKKALFPLCWIPGYLPRGMEDGNISCTYLVSLLCFAYICLSMSQLLYKT